MRIRFINIVFLFLLFNVVIAQPSILPDPYLKFDHLTKRDGLSNNYVLDIYQDRAGFIWIATKDGLNRYDGYNFKVFKNDPLDSLSVSNNIITSIKSDVNGFVWIGTQKGLNKYDPEDGNFRRFYFADSTSQTQEGNFIRAILPDDSGFIWVETADGFLHKFNETHSEAKSFKHRYPSMINTYYYHTIFKDRNEDIWVGGRYMGIIKFSVESEQFSVYKEDPNDVSKKRDNDVSEYFEDSEGVFWISGTDGLYTFDTKNEIFEKFLPTSTFSIQEDNNRHLWIGTGDGIYVLNKEKNRLSHFSHNDNNIHSLLNDHVNKVFIDRNQNVWIGTRDGLSIFRPSKNKFRQIYHIPENDNTPTSNHITSILEDSQHRIWLGTASEGLECFDEDFQKRYQYNRSGTGPYQLVSNKISVLMEDNDGDVWVGLWSGRGFHIVNPISGKNKHYQLLENSLKADWYNDFLQDKNGKFWVGIWGSQGLFTFDKIKGKFTSRRYVSFMSSYNTPVRGIAHDGSFVWPAFKNQARFCCLDPVSGKYNFYSKDHYFPFGFDRIEKLHSDNKGEVWFQTNNGNYLKSENPYFNFQKHMYFPDSDTEIVDKAFIQKAIGKDVLCSVRDNKGNVWVGTYEGLYKTRNSRIVKRYQCSSETGLISDTIWSIDFKPPHEIWLGTNQGVCMFQIETKKFKSYNHSEDVYLSSRLISFVFEDRDGFIWVGTTNRGVNRLNPESNRIIQFIPDQTRSTAFWGDEASCIYQDSNGDIWIGGIGLNKFDHETEVFEHLTEVNGLTNNEISGILEDNENYLWVSTKYGLSKINLLGLTIQNFYEKDGLPENEFSRATCKLENGLLLFGGKNGMVLIDPDEFHRDTLPPSIAFTSFKIFDNHYNVSFSKEQAIELNYDQNYFSFEFTALDFSDPLLNSFAYKLEDFDNDWNYTTGANRVAKYTNVDPGHYTFQVKAANMDGVWNMEGLSVSVIIKPPFWKATWFYILEFIVLVLTVILIVKYREKKMMEQNRFLMLEQKLLRSQMNPHFIFNSLSSIQSFIFESNPIEAGSYLSRFADLIRSILYNSREEFISLEKEIKTLRNYLELQQLRYNQKFDFELDVDPLLDIENMSIPPMLAQPFIENAIEHGIKHIDERGLISISFTLMDDSILLMVEDNGIGIKAAKKMKNKKGQEHKSLATIITKERIEILNKGKRKKLYSMQINDTFDANGNVDGTKVKFILPFIQT